MVCAGCSVEHPQSEGSLLLISPPFCRRLLEAWGHFSALSDYMDRPYLSRISASLPTLHLYTTFETSCLLESLIYQDICKGYSVIVIDPHGDLVDHVLAQMPEDRVKDTYLLDIEDTSYPFGINLFAAPANANHVLQTMAIERLMHVFERVFPASARMLLEKYLENIALVFLENPGYTVADIPRFLGDEQFRRALTNNKKLKNIATLIGTMLVANIHAATFSFENKPRSQRPGFSLYVDEFQHFSTLDFAELFTEARKYKARQTVAHQFTKQLTLEELREATTTAYTVVAFRTTDEDSRKFAPLFSDLDLQRDQPTTIYRDNIFKRLYTHPDQKVREFAASVIAELEEASKKKITKRIEEEDHSYYVVETKVDVLPRHDFGEGLVDYHPDFIHRLLKRLDLLLYETMGDKKINLRLWADFVRDMSALLQFSDFFTLAYNKWDGHGSFETWLEKHDGESDAEIGTVVKMSVQYFAFHQFIDRLNAVLDALIEQPLAEKRETTINDIAKRLSHLPNYTVLVRVGTETHLIKPLPLPRTTVSGSDFWQRKRSIQVQSARKYGRKREDIEKELGARQGASHEQAADEIDTDTDNEQPFSRFEEL
jgi:hypothetical protein